MPTSLIKRGLTAIRMAILKFRPTRIRMDGTLMYTGPVTILVMIVLRGAIFFGC
jgi:hypothetical protein